MDKLKMQLSKCRNIINKGYTSARNSGIVWLNSFCAEFLKFTNDLHILLALEMGSAAETDGNEAVETIFLCLSQIVICIQHMEHTIKAEQSGGVAISASRQHFLDRIHWCLDRLRVALSTLATTGGKQLPEELTFVELMDLALDHLAPYSTYKETSDGTANVAEENAEAMFASKQIRSTVDLILSHTLAFANVALKQDKKALSALCQKVLRECIALQDECVLNAQQTMRNDCNRKLKAMSLENALYQLEDYINEALLRLVYVTFLDHSKFSIEKLRTFMRCSEPDDPALDELIADFDVNVDRTTQIGIFAIAFAPNVKIKTIVRSCLASLESLDSCIIPSLQSKHTADVHAEILEQHFNEEVAKFKCAIQEIIDSHAFAACYYEMLTQTITNMEKQFCKLQLQELVQIGEFLYEHFQLRVNNKELRKVVGVTPAHERLQLFERFTLMLRECQAILMCADQVQPQRVLKRFKILRSVLRKFLDALNETDGGGATNSQKHKSNVFIMSEDLSDSQRMFESIGISPSIRSILYRQELATTPRRQQRASSDSLQANFSKMARISPMVLNAQMRLQANAEASASTEPPFKDNNLPETARCSVRRKESLRTAMFKRQKSTESEHVYKIYRNNSASLQITDILDQLTSLSSNFTNQYSVSSN